MLFGDSFGWIRATLVRTALVAVAAAGLAAVPPAVAAPPPADQPKPAHPLVWDAMRKTIEPKPGETSAGFQFTVTNVSDTAVTIQQIRPTCGCTVAEMPADPWVLAPKSSGTFIGNIEFRGERGTLTKSIFVNSTAGTQMLALVIKIPDEDPPERLRQQKIALADRQAVLRGECAKCHVPTDGQRGESLFSAACGICHFAARRADAVPDLLHARQHRDAAFWRTWIAEGKAGSMMPAWSKAKGGPLSDEQIASLVEYALQTLPTEPRPDDPAPHP